MSDSNPYAAPRNPQQVVPARTMQKLWATVARVAAAQILLVPPGLIQEVFPAALPQGLVPSLVVALHSILSMVSAWRIGRRDSRRRAVYGSFLLSVIAWALFAGGVIGGFTVVNGRIPADWRFVLLLGVVPVGLSLTAALVGGIFRRP